MQRLVLILSATALLADCRSATVNRQTRLPDIDNSIRPNAIPSKHAGAIKKLLAITRRPDPVTPHKSDTTLELTCEAIGAPAPTVHWFKNDAPVYEHGLESNEILDSNPTSLARVTSTLLISRTKGQDEYTCLVSSGSKTARASATVYSVDGNTDFSERAKLVPLSPRVLVWYKVYMDAIGSTVVLPCKAKGHPRPRVVWTDNKGAVVKDGRMKVLRSGELVIPSLRWNDMGEYTCRASNTFGSEEANTFVYPAKAG